MPACVRLSTIDSGRGVLVSGTPAAGTAAMAVVTAPGQLLLWSAAAVMAAPDVVVAVAGQLLLLISSWSSSELSANCHTRVRAKCQANCHAA